MASHVGKECYAIIWRRQETNNLTIGKAQRKGHTFTREGKPKCTTLTPRYDQSLPKYQVLHPFKKKQHIYNKIKTQALITGTNMKGKLSSVIMEDNCSQEDITVSGRGRMFSKWLITLKNKEIDRK